jgi:predicted transcriptional regulator
MLDLSCRRFILDDVIKCSFGLTKAEFMVLSYFLKNPASSFTTGELSDKTGLDKSTIQRCVKKLNEKGVVVRFRKNLDAGGYVYLYRAMARSEISRQVISTVRIWVSMVEAEIISW